MYIEDNNDRLPPNNGNNTSGFMASRDAHYPYTWAAGGLDRISTPDNTNRLYLERSQLWPYHKSFSINDSFFVVDMVGYLTQPERQMIVDVPASYHNGAGALNFADGHSEIRRWNDPRTRPALTATSSAQHLMTPKNPDLTWLQARSTALR